MTPTPHDPASSGPPAAGKSTLPPEAPVPGLEPGLTSPAEGQGAPGDPAAADPPDQLAARPDPEATRFSAGDPPLTDPNATRCQGTDAPAAAWPQRSFADYEILAKIGPGGQGIVYKARHLSSGQLVALKMIRKDLLSNPDALRRWHREVAAGATLSHPNIVRLIDADQVNDMPYLVMEYIGGLDLRRLVERTGPLPVARASDFIRQAARGLEHALENHLVHRDIKPANLMVTREAAEAVPGSTGQTAAPDLSQAALLAPGLLAEETHSASPGR